MARIDQAQGGEYIVLLPEALDRQEVKEPWEQIQFLFKEKSLRILTLDFSDVATIDSAGAAFLQEVRRAGRERGVEIHHHSMPDPVLHFLHSLNWEQEPRIPREHRPPRGLIYQIGQGTWDQYQDLLGIIRFSGQFVLSLLRLLRKIHRFRWKETAYYIQLTGADAMPIIFLISFLMGLVMAFQAAVQMSKFGANIYVANLVAISMARELGPVLTAVILAGRSGSAFASEIGTMVVNEEVDALVVMEFDTMEFLVLPKVFALIAVAPLLTVLANSSGILGGVVVGVTSLDVSPSAFIEQAMRFLRTKDVVGGLIKSVAFAGAIAIVGCLRGLQTAREADSVGRQTTSAVVTGIFLIIFLDAVFTAIYHVFKY